MTAADTLGARAGDGKTLAVPFGMALVPLEPTEEMGDAGERAWLLNVPPGSTWAAACEIVYRAMLAAAPAAAPAWQPIAADLRGIAEQAGMRVNLLSMGAASMVYSDGCEGVTRAHLERFAALYGFACWNAALEANPPNMQGFVSRAITDAIGGAA